MRRLGVGSSSGVERPLRAQIVVALIVVLMLIAVPLYLLRRPSAKRATAPVPSASTDAGTGTAPLAINALADAGAPTERLRLAPAQRVRCGASATRGNEGGLCEALPAFEEALAKAVRESVDCAPKTNEAGTINFVLTIDFAKKSLHVFPGASGEWRGRKARRATNCVKRALTVSDWNVTHQHRYYTIAVLATYTPTTGPAAAPTLRNPTATPNFE